ncbi:ZP2 [Triplophysa rosa]|uniref:Zona pellucida sperm-binding protein 4 n=1 Tax=Triplophysa rosa TaxID=992332 RepID=A0A9W7X373_TRIRA|nr:ZP2 [Triplophysa rosa]
MAGTAGKFCLVANFCVWFCAFCRAVPQFSNFPQEPQSSVFQQTEQQFSQKIPLQKPVVQSEPLDKSAVADYEQIQCGQPGISGAKCEAISCCFNGQQCYYGMSVTVQCIRDGQFMFVVARDVTLPRLSLDTVRLLGGNEAPCGPVGSTPSFAIYQFLDTASGTSMMCRYSATAVEALVLEVNTVPPPPPVAAPGPLRVELRLANGQCVTKGCAEDVLARMTSYLTILVPVVGSSGLQFPTHYKRVVVKMFTFVDPSSLAPLQETIYIHCSTAVCHPASDSCEQSCARKRRAVAGKRSEETGFQWRCFLYKNKDIYTDLEQLQSNSLFLSVFSQSEALTTPGEETIFPLNSLSPLKPLVMGRAVTHPDSGDPLKSWTTELHSSCHNTSDMIERQSYPALGMETIRRWARCSEQTRGSRWQLMPATTSPPQTHVIELQETNDP